jgi:hypothetical protein
MNNSVAQTIEERWVRVAAGPMMLDGDLSLPNESCGVVLFAHGSGGSRHSSRNRRVARLLNEAKFATVLIDLLTLDEEAIDARTGHLRFDIDLLAGRLVGVTDWLTQYPALDEVARLAREWFHRYLNPVARQAAGAGSKPTLSRHTAGCPAAISARATQTRQARFSIPRMDRQNSAFIRCSPLDRVLIKDAQQR